MAQGPEYTQVEKPLISQLTQMGWTHLEGAPPGVPAPTDPRKSARTSFSQIFLEERLKAQLGVINRGPDGKAWLDDRRISQAVGALTRIAAPSLLEANQKATELLLNGITVDGLPGWDGGRDQRVRYIDWDNPLRNDFVVVSQFRVDIPGTQGRKCIVPDEVLFVNGIPLALVECKKPGSALGEAVKQHLRYADRRGALPQEGNAKLFHTMQLLVATSGDKAALGSITSGPQHYAPWRDPYPFSTEELAHRLKKREAAVNQQARCNSRPTSSITCSFTNWPTSAILITARTSGVPSSARCPTSLLAAPASAWPALPSGFPAADSVVGDEHGDAAGGEVRHVGGGRRGFG